MDRKIFGVTALILIALVFTVMFGFGVVTTYAARSSLPGDVLFPVKTAMEDAQVSVMPDPIRDAELQMSFAQRRLDEMAALIDEDRFSSLDHTAGLFELNIDGAIQSVGDVAAQDPSQADDLLFNIVAALSRYSDILTDLRNTSPVAAQTALERALIASRESIHDTVEVEFNGVVESIADDVWVIDGTSVTIAIFTEIYEPISVGDSVEVKALLLMDGTLVALEIELTDDNSNDNGNQNGNDNGNQNGNDNGNQNDNDNGNQNDNDNGNQNDNDNGNQNDNDNENENENGNQNDNDNGNQNDNDNGNQNDNDNGNQNDNDNGNQNDNDNGNQNDNDNENENGNENS